MAFDKKMFNSNFPFAFKVAVANNIRIAIKAFEEFWKKNSDFLKNADELHGRILTYAIKHQFLMESTNTASHYIVDSQSTNAFKCNALFLKTTDYIANICRTGSPQQLPCKARYKQQLALGNREDEIQLEFPFISNADSTQAVPPKKYALLTYSYKRSELQHLSLIVPDWQFKNILYSDNLFNQINEFYNYVPQELFEEKVASLKANLVQNKTKFHIVGD